MRTLAALLGVSALLTASAAGAATYDFAFSIIYDGVPESAVHFSLDSQAGDYDAASQVTEFFNVNAYGDDGTFYGVENEIDVSSESLQAIQYETSGVNTTSILFEETDGGSISSGVGQNIVFLPGLHAGATLVGRSIPPARLNIRLAGAAPEPQTWLLMAMGVGLAGWSLRRRRALVASA